MPGQMPCAGVWCIAAADTRLVSHIPPLFFRYHHPGACIPSGRALLQAAGCRVAPVPA